MKTKNPAAVAMGRLGGSVKSTAKSAAAKARMAKKQAELANLRAENEKLKNLLAEKK